MNYAYRLFERLFFGGVVSLSERAKAKPAKFTDLDAWLENLPPAELAGALSMLRDLGRWPALELLDVFREDSEQERGEELVFGEKQIYRWRKANGVTR